MTICGNLLSVWITQAIMKGKSIFEEQNIKTNYVKAMKQGKQISCGNMANKRLFHSEFDDWNNLEIDDT